MKPWQFDQPTQIIIPCQIKTTPCKVLSQLFPAAASSSDYLLSARRSSEICSGEEEAMAVRSPDKDKHRSPTFIHKFLENPKVVLAFALLLIDALLVSLIIAYIPYTKIDWDAYLSQVSGFLDGERDYMDLKGDTGPLVYPAGFLYIYSAVKFVTGGQVFPAQILFGILYILNLGIVYFHLCEDPCGPLLVLTSYS